MAIDVMTEQYRTECREAVRDAPSDPQWDVVLGFDGYRDRVRKVLADRESATDYDTMDTMAEFATRLQNSVDLNNSASLEWTVVDERAGGHVSNAGRAYAAIGATPTLIGTFGEDENVFRRTLPEAELHSVGTPSVTDAIEFDDGKLMLTDLRSMSSLDWDTLTNRIGIETLTRTLKGAELLSTGYWATIPALPSIWRGLRTEVWPRLADPPSEVLVDPSDLRRMSPERVRDGHQELAALDETVPVTVSTNRAETLALAEMILDHHTDQLHELVGPLRDRLGITRLVAHAESVSILATPDGTYRCHPPHVESPELTTGVGDCFNAGYLSGQLLELSAGGSLLLANVAANSFLQTGSPPSQDALAAQLTEIEVR